MVLTIAGYLSELAVPTGRAVAAERGPAARLDRVVETHTAFCECYPASLDGQIGLMRRPADELASIVSPRGLPRARRRDGRLPGLGRRRPPALQAPGRP